MLSKKGRMIITLAIVAGLLGSLSFSNLAHTSPITTVYVDPPSITRATGETFTVDISIADVEDLYAYAFKLKWNGPVLNATSITEGPFLEQGGTTFFVPKIFNEPDPAGESDYIYVVNTLMGAVPGVNGSGVLATVTFLVEAEGESALDLYETQLLNSLTVEIAHTVEDGYFIGKAATEASLVGRGAWPEHKHFSISKDEDGVQTLYGKVKNLGEEPCYIRVNFTVWDIGGVATIFIGKHEVGGEEIKVLPGETVDITVNLWASRETAWQLGSYSVKATCLHSADGTYWLKDGVKEFNFTIVP